MCRIHISSRDTHFSPHVTPAHRTGCQGILQTLRFHLPLSRQFLVQREREGEKVFTHSVKSQADALVYQINQSVVRLRAHISSRVPTPAQTAPSARVLTRYSTFSVFYRAELPLGGSSLLPNQPTSQPDERMVDTSLQENTAAGSETTQWHEKEGKGSTPTSAVHFKR